MQTSFQGIKGRLKKKNGRNHESAKSQTSEFLSSLKFKATQRGSSREPTVTSFATRSPINGSPMRHLSPIDPTQIPVDTPNESSGDIGTKSRSRIQRRGVQNPKPASSLESGGKFNFEIGKPDSLTELVKVKEELRIMKQKLKNQKENSMKGSNLNSENLSKKNEEIDELRHMLQKKDHWIDTLKLEVKKIDNSLKRQKKAQED